MKTAARLLRFGTGAEAFAPTGPPAFDPIQLPFSVVFEARTGRRLDAGGSPASLPGDPVGVWQSRTGGGREASQSVFAARPVYQSASGSPVLRFTADDFLTVPQGADAPGFGDAVTVAVRIATQATGTFQGIASVGSSAALGAWFLALDGVGRVGLGAVGSGFCVATADPLPSGTHCIIARKNGTTTSLRVDGQEVGAATPGTTFVTRSGPLTVGGVQGYTLNFNGDMWFLASAPAYLTDADCEQVENYCALL